MSTRQIPCPYQDSGCIRRFKREGDLTWHVTMMHWKAGQSVASTPTVGNLPSPSPGHSPPPNYLNQDIPPEPSNQRKRKTRNYHPFLTGEHCDAEGRPVTPDTPPPPRGPLPNVWNLFQTEVQLQLADFLYCKVQMSQSDIDLLMELWALAAAQSESSSPFSDHNHMFAEIDNIRVGDAPWQCFETAVPDNPGPNAPEWLSRSYQVWFHDPNTVIRNILDNPDFAQEFDTAPFVPLDSNDTRRWSNFMSGNLSWRHATKIYEDDPSTEGSMLVPIILGADKTTVSVATGNAEYHLLYLSIGNLRNSAQQGHRNGVIPIGFLAIPKGMTIPVICHCPDGHFRRCIYDLAAFIADYPEKVLLAGISVSSWCPKCTSQPSNLDQISPRRSCEHTAVLIEQFSADNDVLWNNYGIANQNVQPFTAHFPRADIHEMLSLTFSTKLLKELSKTTLSSEGKTRADEIMDDIDAQIAVTPPFPGLRQFPQGRRFKQWTGDDSKALMKVYLSAIADYMPESIMKCLSTFMDFCYLVQRPTLDETTFKEVQTLIDRYHHYREAFHMSGVREHFSLPRQHSKPWRRSNRYNALSQMLLINQRLDKLDVTPALDPFDAGVEDMGAAGDEESLLGEVKLAKTYERSYPTDISLLSRYLNQPNLESLACFFLYEQLNGEPPPPDYRNEDLPAIGSIVRVFHSAVATFHAPSDISGTHGMRRERIQATPQWYGYPRYDCVLSVESEEKGFRGINAACIRLFFSFQYDNVEYQCALVHWYKRHSRTPSDVKTGMWVVEPHYHNEEPFMAVIHLDTILRGAHLLPVFGLTAIPKKLHFSQSLDVFTAFYVSKYADHQMNEIIH
ncbi:hypothetical protein BDP27DRAFT_1385099 [Rhodocollybia butyracea]|uniref:C2H2-type domain-containing protein n=1 Tax=Rhodocollybia butyracea TaxID=206335 RepID=A0A9P5U1P8_9AGAR|nr:hypothetical protein BDP27DRAFT_1385099 [Rhodocollybia butyracea]